MPVTYRSGDIVSPYIPFVEPLLVQDTHFIDCVRTGATPDTSGERGLDVVRVLAATDVAAPTGLATSVPRRRLDVPSGDAGLATGGRRDGHVRTTRCRSSTSAGVNGALRDEYDLGWKAVLGHGRFIGGAEVARFEASSPPTAGSGTAWASPTAPTRSS